MKIRNKTEKCITLALFAALIGAYLAFDVGCLFRALFGISCPGCGMTRAYLSLFSGDLALAFSYHPMFWSVPILLVYYLFDGHVFRIKWLNAGIFSAILLGFFLVFFIRLF